MFMRSVLQGSGRSLSEPHAPACQGHRQPAVAHHLVVEAAGLIPAAVARAASIPEAEQLAAAESVAKLIGRPGTVAADLGLRARALNREMLDHVVHGFGRSHTSGVKPDVQHYPNGSPEQIHQLKESLLIGSIVF